MADLNHLLEELEQAEQQEQQIDDDEKLYNQDGSIGNNNNDNNNGDDNDDDEGNHNERISAGGGDGTTTLEDAFSDPAMGTTTTAAPARISFPPAQAASRLSNHHYNIHNRNDDNDDAFPDRLDMEDVIGAMMDHHTNHDDKDHRMATEAPSLEEQAAAYQLLKTWWIQEVHAPELLPWNESLVQGWIAWLDRDNHDNDNDDNDTDQAAATTTTHEQAQLRALLQGIARIDRQRLSFVLSNLLAVRLHKIQLHHLYYVQTYGGRRHEDEEEAQEEEPGHHPSVNTTTWLSAAERDFLLAYHALWTRHMQRTVTDHFPQSAWKALDEPDMVPKPNVDAYCWIRVVRDTVLQHSQHHDDNDPNDVHDDAYPSQSQQRYPAGTTLILPYRQVQELVRDPTSGVQLTL
ncbi:hypothetical protein ACA910_001954 [Epithemia clementina (nom. ined.)]